MISLPDEASMKAALERPLEKRLHALLADRIHDTEATDLLDLTHIVVVEARDRDEDLVDELGMSLLTNPLDGARFGMRGFEPLFDWIEDHNGWYELVITVGNDGFAYVVFIESAAGADPRLMDLCRTYSADATEAVS